MDTPLLVRDRRTKTAYVPPPPVVDVDDGEFFVGPTDEVMTSTYVSDE
jgi:hypothetical protein